MNKKIFTCRKRNDAGQKAINCLHYMSLGIDETCGRDFDNRCACIVRFGEICKNFEGELVNGTS